MTFPGTGACCIRWPWRFTWSDESSLAASRSSSRLPSGGGNFRRARRAAECRLLQALSGEMNVVRLVFSYPDLNTYELEEARNAADPEYARVASAMPFVEGTLAYELYREIDAT